MRELFKPPEPPFVLLKMEVMVSISDYCSLFYSNSVFAVDPAFLVLDAGDTVVNKTHDLCPQGAWSRVPERLDLIDHQK